MVLVLVVVLATAALWLALRTEPAPRPTNDAARTTAQQSRATDNTPTRKTDPTPRDRPDPQPRPEPRTDTPQPPPDPADAPSETHWSVRGRLVAITCAGVNLLDFPCYGLEATVDCVWLGPDYPQHLQDTVRVDLTRRFTFESGLAREEHPDPTRLMWQVTVSGYGEGELARFVALWHDAEDDAKPDIATVRGLHRPVLRDGWVDFGDLRLSLDEAEHPPIILAGRVLVPGGQPLASRQSLMLTARQGDEAEHTFFLRVNRQGRFAYVMSGTDFDPPLTAEGLEPMAWTLEISAESDSFGMGMGMRRGIPVGLTAFELGPPKRTGNVLDFGDIAARGAVLEILAEIEGHTPKPLPCDPLLLDPGEDDVPLEGCDLSLESGDEYLNIWADIGLTLRMLLPEGRYAWNAEPEDVRPPVTPQFGSVVARDGAVSRLEIRFTPAPLIPVRVIAPEGTDLSGLAVHWDVELIEDEQWWSGDCDKDLRVPMLPGRKTEVSGSLPGFAPVYVVLEPGATEAVLEFSEAVPRGGTLTIKLPSLPEALGKTLTATLQIQWLDEEEPGEFRSVREESVTLAPGHQGEITRPDAAPGRIQIILMCADALGYPGGVLSRLDDITLAGGQTLAVELPPIGNPPWATPANRVMARVSVGGQPSSLWGLWEYAWATGRRTVNDDDILVWAEDLRNGRGAGGGFIPAALVHDSTRVPVRVEPPAEAWGTARAVIEPPCRLRLRVTRGGKPVSEFTARLSANARTHTTQCTTRAVDGVACLWCPGEECLLHIECDNTMVHSRAVKLPASGEGELTVEIGLVRVSVRRDGDGDNDLASWVLRREGPESIGNIGLHSGQVLYLKPGPYRAVPEAPADTAAAFAVDLSDGADRELVLPALKLPAMTGVLLAMTEADWQGYLSGAFEYYVVRDSGAGQTAGFAGEALDLGIRPMPDGILLAGLPLDTRVLVRGWYRRRTATGVEYRVMKPADFTVAADKKLEPAWVQGTTLDWEWESLELRSTSDFPGFYVFFGQQQVVGAGRHELLIYTGDEPLRASVTIPAGAREFKIPPELRKRLEDLNLIEPDDE